MSDQTFQNLQNVQPKSHKGLWIALAVVLVIALAGGGYYMYSKHKKADEDSKSD